MNNLQSPLAYRDPTCQQYYKYKSYLIDNDVKIRGQTVKNHFLNDNAHIVSAVPRAHYPTKVPLVADLISPFEQPLYIQRIKEFRDQELPNAIKEIKEKIDKKIRSFTELASHYAGIDNPLQDEDEEKGAVATTRVKKEDTLSRTSNKKKGARWITKVEEKPITSDEEMGALVTLISDKMSDEQKEAMKRNFSYLNNKTQLFQTVIKECANTRDKLEQSHNAQANFQKNAARFSQAVGLELNLTSIAEKSIVEDYRSNLPFVEKWEQLANKYWGYEKNPAILDNDLKKRTENVLMYLNNFSQQSEFIHEEWHALIKEIADLLYQKEEWQALLKVG